MLQIIPQPVCIGIIDAPIQLKQDMHSLPAYLDFSIDVSDIDGRAFTVVVRSDIGEAREQSYFPYSDADLDHELLKLENAILRSTDIHRHAPTSHSDVVEHLGRVLFDFVLPGEARSLYNECLREAEHRHRGVRLKLSIHSPRLAALPWEFLYDPRRRDFVCLNSYTPLVRYTELPQTAPPLQINSPLRILGILSDPKDMPMRLDVAQERDQITEAVRSLLDRGLVELTWLEGNSWRDLQRIMRSGNEGWHIFHFIGHGGYDTLRNEGYIVLNNEDGTSHNLYASQLARLLIRQRSTMRLVLLNACEGARTGTHDALSSTAATLITSGIPAVLAMQYEITNEAAIEFANAFYEALADSLPVDAAVAEARNALSIGNVRSLEWGVPVLHMRATDGRLFSIQDVGDGVPAIAPSQLPSDSQLTNGIPRQIAQSVSVERSTYMPTSASYSQPRSALASLDLVTKAIAERGDRPYASQESVVPDELTSIISAAIEEHHVEAELCQESPVASTAPLTKLERTGVQTIAQLDEGLLAEASARLQGETYTLPSVDTAHRFFDEDDEGEVVESPDEQEFHAKGRGAPHVDPLDVDNLFESYKKRQHVLIGFDWVEIPAGNFLFGSDPLVDEHHFDDELPQTRVYLETYRISRVAVTNAQYKLFIDAVGYAAPPHWLNGEYPEGQQDYPVANITWHDADTFCEWAGVRLPTELEWEKAARGTDGRIYPWGNQEPDPARCNFNQTVGMAVAVGCYPDGASPYHVLDMAGNVWEWTATPWLDNYEDYLARQAKVSQSPLRYVLRGGGFRDLEFIRCAARSWDLPNQRYRDIGFRVVAH